jgi:hypothetical protein
MSKALTGHTVNGPYHYDSDLHPSFRLVGPEGIVASVFAYDGDIEAAERRAEIMACALDRALAETP